MPLKDGYQVEKELKQEGTKIADAITDHIKDAHRNWGFILFLCDYGTGQIQYVSDIDSGDALGLMQTYINRMKQ